MQSRDTVILTTKDSAALVRVAADFLYFAQVQSAIHAEDESADGLRPEIAAHLVRIRSLFIPHGVLIPASLSESESPSEEATEFEGGEIIGNGRFWDACNVAFRRNPVFADFRPESRAATNQDVILNGVIEGAQTLLPPDPIRVVGESSGPLDDILRPIGMSHVRPDSMKALGVRIITSLSRIKYAVRGLWRPKEQLSGLNGTPLNNFRASTSEETDARVPNRTYFVRINDKLVFPDPAREERGSMVHLITELAKAVNNVTQANMDLVFNQDPPEQGAPRGMRSALLGMIDLVFRLDNFAKRILPFIKFREEALRNKLVKYSANIGATQDYAVTLDPDSEIYSRTSLLFGDEPIAEELEAERNTIARMRIEQFFIKYDSAIRQMADLVERPDEEPLQGDTEEEHEQEKAVVAVNDVLFKTLAVAGGIAFGVSQGIGGAETMLAATIMGGTIYAYRDWLTYLSDKFSGMLGIETPRIFGVGSFSGFSPEIVSKILVLRRRAAWMGAITLMGTALLYSYDGTPVVEAVMIATTQTVANYYTDIVAYMVATVGVGYFEQSSLGQRLENFLDTKPLGRFTPSFGTVRTLAIYGGGLAITCMLTWRALDLINGNPSIIVTQSTGFVTPVAAFLNQYLSINMHNIQGAWAGPGFIRWLAQGTMSHLFGTATVAGTAAAIGGYVGNQSVAYALASVFQPVLALASFLGSSYIGLASTMFGLLTVAVPVFSRAIYKSQDELAKQQKGWDDEIIKPASLQDPDFTVPLSQWTKLVPNRCLNSPAFGTGNYQINIQFGSKDGVLTAAYEKIKRTIGPQIDSLSPETFTKVFGKLGYANKTQAIDHYSMLLTQQCDEPEVAATLGGKNKIFANLAQNSPMTITSLFNKGSQLFDSRHLKFKIPPQANNSTFFTTAEIVGTKDPMPIYYSRITTKALNAGKFYEDWFKDKFMPAERLLRDDTDLDSEPFNKTIRNYVDDVTRVVDTFTPPNVTMTGVAKQTVRAFIQLLFGVGAGFLEIVVYVGGREAVEFSATRTAALMGFETPDDMRSFFRANDYLPEKAGDVVRLVFGTVSFAFWALAAAAVIGTGRLIKGTMEAIFGRVVRPLAFLSGWSASRQTQAGIEVLPSAPGQIPQAGQVAQLTEQQDEQQLARNRSGRRFVRPSKGLGDDDNLKRPFSLVEESQASSQETKYPRMFEEESTQSGSSYSVDEAGEAALVKIISNLSRYMGVQDDKFGYLLSGLNHSEYLRNHVLHVIGRLREPELIDFTKIKHMRISDEPFPELKIPADAHLIKFNDAVPNPDDAEAMALYIADQDDKKALKVYIDNMMTGFNTRQPVTDTWVSVLDLLVIASTYTILMST
jgi:hypothetical protein